MSVVKRQNKQEAQKPEKRSLSYRLAEHVIGLLPEPRKKRLNLVLSEMHIERLERLQRLTDASSVAEVVRNSLSVYEILVQKARAGSHFQELTSKGHLFPMELRIDVVRGPENHGDNVVRVHSSEVSARDSRETAEGLARKTG